MTTPTEPPATPFDKDLLRQREIAAQERALRAPLANVRAAAARRLGEIHAGLDGLLDALRDPNEGVRAAAAAALGNFHDDARRLVIVDELLAAIDDPSERVCQSAIRSLGLLRASAAQQEIEEFLEDSNQHLAGTAVLALARIAEHEEHGDLAARLAGLLEHPSRYVRMQAVRAVGILKYQPAEPRILGMIQQTRAERAATRQPAETRPAISAARDFHEDEHYALLNQLVRTVGELRIADAAPILLEIARKDIGLRGLAIEALILNEVEIDLDLLTGLLSDPSALLRRRVILLIAQAGYRAALPVLRPLLNDESVTTRGAALQALTQLGDREALPGIEWVAFRDGNPFLRLQALHSLAALAGSDALSQMISLAGDSNFEVRRGAVGYLLRWNQGQQETLLALARFALEFPEDDLNSPIAELLQQKGFDPNCLNQIEPPPALTALPAELREQSGRLLELLESWQTALRQRNAPSYSLVNRRTLTALAFLIDRLKSPE